MLKSINLNVKFVSSQNSHSLTSLLVFWLCLVTPDNGPEKGPKHVALLKVIKHFYVRQ